MRSADVEAVPNENFEPMMPTVVDGARVDIRTLGVLGSTPAGQRWALKHLHPNGETVTSSAGIPDHTHVPVVTPEYRSNYVIEGVTGATATNDNVDVLFIGAMDLAFLYRRYPAGNPPADIWKAVYYAASGMTGRSVDFDVAPSSSDPTPEKKVCGVLFGTSSQNYPKSRGMYAGMTITFDAPALYDQGRLVAGQLPLIRDKRATAAEMATLADPTPEYPEVMGNFAKMGQIPLSEDELFQASPGTIVHEAREGVYIPLRFNEPVQLFTDSELADDYNQPQVLCFTRENESIHNSVSFRGPAPDGTIANYGTEGLYNFLTGVVLFRGISGAANLSVKTRIGIEAQVERGTAVAPFQHASPPLDKEAIDQVTRVSQMTPMAYPSCYNDLGEILNVIKKVLGGIKNVGGVLGGLGVPMVGGISGLLGQLGFAPSGRKGRSRALRTALAMSHY
jgi:hypothetical protein